MSPWNPARMPGADGPGTAKAYGGSPRRQERDFGRVFTGLLFALFVATLLMAILVGTGVYRVLHQEGAGADGFEAAAAAEDSRSLFQGPALVLRETLPSGVYETRLYRYDGTIMEEYALADAPYDPLKATAIVDSSVFAFSYEDSLLTIETDAGATAVALRSGGGER